MFSLKRPFILFFLCVLSLNEFAQTKHYFFIEADGQQPFYAKWNGKLMSSSAAGFLLVPGNDEDKVLVSIGFPKNQFPEQTFELLGMNGDRGFQLKNFGDKGWGLFDRTTMAIIMPIKANTNNVSSSIKIAENSFESVLADVTGDSTLSKNKSEPTPAVDTKSQLLFVTTPLRDSLIQGDKIKNLPITEFLMSENGQEKVMGYLLKNKNGENDTIKIAISKSVPVVDQSLTMSAKKPEASIQKEIPKIPSGSTSKISVCDRPFSDMKDVRALQRKILSSTDAAEQIAFVVKAFKDKCYNSRQTMDLGWMITDEGVRLSLFKALYGLVSDPEQFGLLENVFLKDENIKAFRKILGKN